jgi:glycosyltransferase involved in cell wall biosynthesis
MRSVLVHIISGLRRGGAENLLYNLCRKSPDYEHHVISLTGEDYYSTLLRESGVKVYTINIDWRIDKLWAKINKLTKLIIKINPSVVQTWMYHADLLGGYAARKAGITNVNWGIHNLYIKLKISNIPTIIVRTLSAMFSRSIPRNIICCSKPVLDYHKYLGYDCSRLVLINNGIDTEKFDNYNSKRKTSNVSPVLGMFARYHMDKDFNNLLDALRILKSNQIPFKCVLAGDGVCDKNIVLNNSIESRSLSDDIRLLGYVPEIEKLYRSLDLFILSSRSEAMGLVLAEAMASGIPCVSTDVGGTSDILGSTGWVVPVSNPEELAKVIIEAINEWKNKQNWSYRQNQCVSRIKTNFNINAMQSQYKQAWAL